MNILKLKDFTTLQNILFEDFLSENALGSFNDEFHSCKNITEPQNKIIKFISTKSK